MPINDADAQVSPAGCVHWALLALRDFHRVAVVFGKMRNHLFSHLALRLYRPG